MADTIPGAQPSVPPWPRIAGQKERRHMCCINGHHTEVCNSNSLEETRLGM